MIEPLRDGFGRKIEYLRISVTDRCNFRCQYCMPVAGLAWLPKSDILTYEEIARVVAELAPLGLRRLRLTGGDRGRAEDVVQETMLRAWRHPEALDPARGEIRPWLFTVARRIAIDAHRAALVRRRLKAS